MTITFVYFYKLIEQSASQTQFATGSWQPGVSLLAKVELSCLLCSIPTAHSMVAFPTSARLPDCYESNSQALSGLQIIGLETRLGLVHIWKILYT